MLWQLLTFWLIHLTMNHIGLLYVEVGLLRSGNKSLLNNLNEGLVILDQNDSNILFANDAAKIFNIKTNKALSLCQERVNIENEKLDLNSKNFAEIDLN